MHHIFYSQATVLEPFKSISMKMTVESGLLEFISEEFFSL